MSEVDEWRLQVLELATSFVHPTEVLFCLVAFSLGLFSIRALA